MERTNLGCFREQITQEEVTGGWTKLHTKNILICILHQILLG